MICKICLNDFNDDDLWTFQNNIGVCRNKKCISINHQLNIIHRVLYPIKLRAASGACEDAAQSEALAQEGFYRDYISD